MSDAALVFQEALRRSREHGGLGSIDSAAPKLGVSRGSLGGYERGDRLPDIDFLARLAAETGADFNELLRLRLEAGGNSPEALGMQVREPSGEYSGLHQRMAARHGPSPNALAAEIRHGPSPSALAAEIRREVQQADVPLEWALLIVQLVAGGDLTVEGARAIIDSIKQERGDDV